LFGKIILSIIPAIYQGRWLIGHSVDDGQIVAKAKFTVPKRSFGVNNASIDPNERPQRFNGILVFEK